MHKHQLTRADAPQHSVYADLNLSSRTCLASRLYQELSHFITLGAYAIYIKDILHTRSQISVVSAT